MIPKNMPPIEIEYFNFNGRVLTLRMVAFYCNVPHTNDRITSDQFKERKMAKKYKFGSLPVINMKDGTQMAQTESLVRWICLSFRGKRGETLYPGKFNPDASYLIDSYAETASGYLSKPWGGYMSGNPIPPEKVKEAIETSWTQLLTLIEKLLSKNSNPNFLVGNSITLADAAFGSFLLKFALGPHNPHKAEYTAEIEKYPKVKKWAYGTIKGAWGAWFDQEPAGNYNNGF